MALPAKIFPYKYCPMGCNAQCRVLVSRLAAMQNINNQHTNRRDNMNANDPMNVWIAGENFPQNTDEIRDLMEAYDIAGFDSADKYDRWSSDEYEFDSDNYGFEDSYEQY